MAYDEKLAQRVRKVLTDLPVVEKKMFGGIAFMVHGHMTVGIVNDDLMVRVGPEQFESALAKPGARPMDFTGKPSKGMIYVDPGALKGRALSGWVKMGLAFVETLPPK